MITNGIIKVVRKKTRIISELNGKIVAAKNEAKNKNEKGLPKKAGPIYNLQKTLFFCLLGWLGFYSWLFGAIGFITHIFWLKLKFKFCTVVGQNIDFTIIGLYDRGSILGSGGSIVAPDAVAGIASPIFQFYAYDIEQENIPQAVTELSSLITPPTVALDVNVIDSLVARFIAQFTCFYFSTSASCYRRGAGGSRRNFIGYAQYQ